MTRIKRIKADFNLLKTNNKKHQSVKIRPIRVIRYLFIDLINHQIKNF
jgi:hypothetical protein